MIKVVTDLYNKYDTAAKYYHTGILKNYIAFEHDIFHKWNQCFNDFKPKKSNSNTAGILEHDTIKYADFIQSLNRDQICIDDIKSVMGNRHKYNIIYTDKDTWLSKDPEFVVPNEEVTGTNLFEGL